jgi:hypothetical protein
MIATRAQRQKKLRSFLEATEGFAAWAWAVRRRVRDSRKLEVTC